MLLAQSDTTAVSGALIGRALEGHWTLNGKPRVTTSALRVDLLELSLMSPANGQTLIWVWSLQSEYGTETSGDRDVHERCDSTLEEVPTVQMNERH
jgi:hypothetical protein